MFLFLKFLDIFREVFFETPLKNFLSLLEEGVWRCSRKKIKFAESMIHGPALFYVNF